MLPKEINLAKQLADALLDLFPLAGLSKSLAKISLEHIFGNAERTASRKSVERLAAEVASQIESIPNERLDNPGSARSAALDIVSILKKSALSPERLVSLNLDPTLIEKNLLSAAQEYIANASAERAGFVTTGLRLVAVAVANAAPELPGVAVAFMQAMLRSRNAQ